MVHHGTSWYIMVHGKLQKNKHTFHIMVKLKFTSTVQNRYLIPEAKYDCKVEMMNSFGASAYEKVNKVGNLGGQLR